MERELLERIAHNTEPKESFQIVVSDNKTKFTTRFNPHIQLKTDKKYEIALVNLETYYSFPLSGLASTGVQKLVGDGLYIKKGGCVLCMRGRNGRTGIVLRTYEW